MQVLKWGVWLIGGLLVSNIVLHRVSATSDKISVREIEIINAKGQTVAFLGTDDKGQARFFLGTPESEAITVIGFDGGPVFIQHMADGRQTGLSAQFGFTQLSETTTEVVTLGLNNEGKGRLRVGNEMDGVNIVADEIAVTRVGEDGDLQKLAVSSLNEGGDGIFKTYNQMGERSWASDALLGDLNADNNVDFTDFTIFARQFGKKK